MCHDGWEGDKCDKVTGPTDLKVSQAGEKSVDVSWKQSKLVEGNEISCVPNSGNANAVYMSVGPNITQVTIQDLESGTEYTVYVYSKIEDQLSPAATTTFKTTLPTVKNLRVLRLSSTAATFGWDHTRDESGKRFDYSALIKK